MSQWTIAEHFQRLRTSTEGTESINLLRLIFLLINFLPGSILCVLNPANIKKIPHLKHLAPISLGCICHEVEIMVVTN